MERTIVNTEIYSWLVANVSRDDIRDSLTRAIVSTGDTYENVVDWRCKSLGFDISMLKRGAIESILCCLSNIRRPEIDALVKSIRKPIREIYRITLSVFLEKYPNIALGDFLNPGKSFHFNNFDVSDFYGGMDLESGGDDVLRTFSDFVSRYHPNIHVQFLWVLEDFFRAFGFYPRIAGDVAIHFFMDISRNLTSLEQTARFLEIVNRDIKIGYWKKLFRDKKLSFSMNSESTGILCDVCFFKYYETVRVNKEANRKFKVELSLSSNAMGDTFVNTLDDGDIISLLKRLDEMNINRNRIYGGHAMEQNNQDVNQNHPLKDDGVVSNDRKGVDEKEGENENQTENRSKEMKAENKIEVKDVTPENNSENKGYSKFKKVLLFGAGIAIGAGLLYLGKKFYDEYIDVCEVAPDTEFFGSEGE